MTVPGTLKAQFDLYETLSAGAEAWKRDHQDAMFCREIEEAVSIGLAILANIRRRSDRWADDVERGKIPFSWEEARDLDELHKWWLQRSALLLEAIDFCESKHYKVDSADQFRQSNLDVSLMSLDTDRNRQSLESIQSGRTITSKQAMDELRSCLRPRGS